MLKIEDDNFKIWYNKDNHTILFEGSLRLWDPSEYTEIKKFMINIHDMGIDQLILDLTNLEFLNSSGISMFCKFVFEIKKYSKTPLVFIGRNEIMWQQKSLHNINKIWDKIELRFID